MFSVLKLWGFGVKSSRNYIIQATFSSMAENISKMSVSKSLVVLSADKAPKEIVSMEVLGETNKPLVVMLPWLNAQRKHLFKFTEYYFKKGCDVVLMDIKAWQLLVPTKGSQLAASELLMFLDKNKIYAPILIHGFSIGGYLWAEVLVQIQADAARYKHVMERIQGQIWDSAADITEIEVGLPFAVFPKNPLLQKMLRAYTATHMRTFENMATKHYRKASETFRSGVLKAPALFLYSKVDPIGTETANLKMKGSWDNLGIQTYHKCWSNSPHVGHYRMYPEEYMENLETFIRKIDFGGKETEKLRSKL